MTRWIKSTALGLILVIPSFMAGWYVGCRFGENKGYVEGYRYAASAVKGAVKEHLEARDRLRDALIDLMEYKIKLQEKEGGK